MTDAPVTAEALRATLAAFEATNAQAPTRTRTKKKAASVCVIVGLIAMIAGFVWAGRTRHPDHQHAVAPSRVTTAQAAAVYRAAVAPVNTAYTTFVHQASAWSEATTSVQATDDARPLTAAIQGIVSELRKLAPRYPAGAPALDRAVRAASTVEADLVALDRLNVDLSVNGWMRLFNSDVERLTTVSNEVRSQLALPAAVSGPSLPRG